MAHPNAELIDRFYQAFQKLDAEAMAACYAEQVQFSDPAFRDLRGRDAGDMWRMLCARAKDFSLTYQVLEADDQQGRARWVATYLFSATGRTVENHIEARFRFADGRDGCMTRREILFHVLNHATYHRGAIGHALDLARVPHPADTYTVFIHQHQPGRREGALPTADPDAGPLTKR